MGAAAERCVAARRLSPCRGRGSSSSSASSLLRLLVWIPAARLPTCSGGFLGGLPSAGRARLLAAAAALCRPSGWPAGRPEGLWAPFLSCAGMTRVFFLASPRLLGRLRLLAAVLRWFAAAVADVSLSLPSEGQGDGPVSCRCEVCPRMLCLVLWKAFLLRSSSGSERCAPVLNTSWMVTLLFGHGHVLKTYGLLQNLWRCLQVLLRGFPSPTSPGLPLQRRVLSPPLCGSAAASHLLLVSTGMVGLRPPAVLPGSSSRLGENKEENN